ncbi:MAG: DUF4190 domain-containing protein [Candidatus Nanopelagicales bacterium]
MTEPSDGWPAITDDESGADLPKGLATASMVLGIMGLVLLLWIGVWSFSILAFVLGMVAYRRAKAGRAGGQRRAIVGIVTGGIGFMHILFTLIVIAPLFQATT